jgi:uncharacterized delta-60 repeat protein
VQRLAARHLMKVLDFLGEKWMRRAVLTLVGCAVSVAWTSNALAQFAGALDTTFGVGGKVTSALQYAGASSDARAVLVQPDGKIIVAGTCDAGANPDFCLSRLNSDGSLDLTFDGPDASGTGVGAGNGVIKFLISFTADSAFSIALQGDGKLVVAGTCNDDDNPGLTSFCLARLNSDGSFDPTFDGPGAAGVGVGTGDGRFVMSLFVGQDGARAVAIQPSDGKIVVSGSCKNTLNNWDFCAARSVVWCWRWIRHD